MFLNHCPFWPPEVPVDGPADGSISAFIHTKPVFCFLFVWILFFGFFCMGHLQCAKVASHYGKENTHKPALAVMAAVCSSRGLSAEKWRASCGSEC